MKQPVIVKLGKPEEKKHVVRYYEKSATDGDKNAVEDVVKSVYINKSALPKPWPSEVTILLEY